MKSSWSKNPIIIVASFFVFLFVFSKFGPKLPISIVSQERGQPMIVEGTGKVTAVPDIAKVSLGIEESGPSLKSVQTNASAKAKRIIDSLKKLGIDEGDIKTVSYNVFPEYSYEGASPKIVGYRVSSSYEIKIKDFDKINDVVAEATNAGANVVGNISFDINEETKKKLLGEAREEAVKEAKDMAQSLARAANVTLGKILNISEFPGGEPPVPIALKEGEAVGGEPTRPSITPGETELSISVSISFEIQ